MLSRDNINNNIKLLCNIMIHLIAHRGIGEENTLNALTAIKRYKNTKQIQYGIEFDIQINKNEHLLCYHDRTLERLHNDTTSIFNLSIDKVKQYNIPHFNDILEDFKDDRFYLNIEIKWYDCEYDYKKLCDKVIETIINKKISNYIISSFNTNIIEYLLTNYTAHTICLISNEYPSIEKMRKYKRLGMNNIVLNKQLFSLSNELKDMKLMYFIIYDKNNTNSSLDDKIIQYAIENNIKIITDDVDKCNKIIMELIA